jgi:DNA polymerase III delta prime subunit
VARLIPPYVSPECRSQAERVVFGLFERDSGCEDWTVFHSFAVARHRVRREGEIDFVVLVPGLGVLCLEIKGGVVARRDGVWIYGAGGPGDRSTVGPFRQAADAMHSLRRHVVAAARDLTSVLFSFAAVFTDTAFDLQSPEWHPWQSIDRSDLERRPIHEVCREVLAQAHRHVASLPHASWYDSCASRLTNEQAKRIVQILRPDFECPLLTRAALDEADDAINRFTQEQFDALDVWSENPRVLVKGPAGTGKTLLALEGARRAISQGHRTLLLCFNSLLGRWLQRQVSEHEKSGAVVAGTFHKLLVSIAGIEPPGTAGTTFWSEELPDLVLERILVEGAIKPFDRLIVDEIQDLVSPRYLDVLDAVVTGGVRSGTWAMFGDFENQSIFSNDASADLAPVRSRSPDVVVFPLRTNCRNSRRVAMALEQVAGMSPPYSRVLAAFPGNAAARFYNRPDDQRAVLREELSRLRRVYRREDIVLLSARADSASCAHGLQDTNSLKPMRAGANDDGTHFCTIHAFKGLEAAAVVVTDITGLRGPTDESLLYIAMSRARHEVVLLLPAELRNAWLDRIMRSQNRRVG